MATDVVASLQVVSIPLVVPFTTAGGSVRERTSVLVRVGSEPAGWGEAAPYPGQDESIEDLLGSATSGHMTPTLAAAVDEAMADRRARIERRPLGGPVRDRIMITVAVGIDGAVERVDELVGLGVRSVKVKIAPGALDHLAAIRDAHPDLVLGVDGNRSFDDAAEVEESLVGLGVAYAEELVAGDDDVPLAILAEAGIPHFADETVRTVEDAGRVIDSARYSGVTIKPGRLGWSGACTVRDLARGAGVRWRASGLLETGIGRAYTNRLAAARDADVCDVAPSRWFLTEPIVDMAHVAGELVVPGGDGIGVEPDQEVVSRFLVDRHEVVLTAG